MADLDTYSVDNILARLSNSTSSIENANPPILASHHPSFLLNLSSDCACDSGIWQQFAPNLHTPFPPPTPWVDPPSALTLQQLGFAFSEEMVEGPNLRELIGSVSPDLAVAAHPKASVPFSNSRFSRTEGAREKSDATGVGSKHTKASNLPAVAAESATKLMQPVYQSEGECQCRAHPKNSASPGNNVPHNLNSQTNGAAATGKKRKAAEDKTIHCLTHAQYHEPKKERRIDEMNIKDCSKEAEEVKKAESHTSASANSGESEDENAKPPEPPKQDYIHVRARRGQATDSHSLAERVRREKISDRMKFLQDLVPGCSKVSGKAVMLDEIINYVQSLQRQVELLSMKLAAVSPRMDFRLDGIFPKEILQEYISPPLFNFNPEFISHFPWLAPVQVKPNQPGVRCVGGFVDSISQSRSTATTILDGGLLTDVNSQFGVDFSRTASLASPSFKDEMCVQQLKFGI